MAHFFYQTKAEYISKSGQKEVAYRSNLLSNITKFCLAIYGMPGSIPLLSAKQLDSCPRRVPAPLLFREFQSNIFLAQIFKYSSFQ